MSVSKLGRAVVIAISALSLLAFAHSHVGAEPTARLVQFAKPGTPEALVQAALVAATDPDEKKGFKAYLALVHPSRKGRRAKRAGAGRRSIKQAIEQIRRYSWKRFRKQAPDYILPESTGGFALARTDPVKVLPTTLTVRVFVAPTNNPQRIVPMPIRLKRADEGWLIMANSL